MPLIPTRPSDNTLTPIYPTTEGLQQASWRKLCGAGAGAAEHRFDSREFAAATAVLAAAATPLSEVLRYLHQPAVDAPQAQLLAGIHPFQQRLAFEELLAHQLSLLHLRAQTRQQGAPGLRRARRNSSGNFYGSCPSN